MTAFRFLALPACVALGCPGTATSAKAQLPVKNVIATNGLSQAGTGFHAQRTIWDKSLQRYYTFYLDDTGKTRVVTYDIASKSYIQNNVVSTVGTNYHYYASAVIDSQGYIHAVHGMHNNKARYSRSTNPHDTSSWTTQILDTDQGTYPYLFVDDQDRLRFVYRAGGGATSGDRIDIASSDDGGTTWSFRRVFDLNNTTAVGAYLTAKMSKSGSLFVAVTERTASANNQNSFRDILFAQSDDFGSTWKRRDGSQYNLPISRQAADVIYSGTQVFPSSIETDANNRPYVVFARQNSSTLDFFDHSELLLAYYDQGWKTRTISPSPTHKYHARIKIGRNGTFVIYAPKILSGSNHSIVQYVSTNSGSSFTSKAFACDVNARAPQVPPENDAPAFIVNFHDNKTLMSIDLANSSGVATCP